MSVLGLFSRDRSPPEIRPADASDAEACAAVHRMGFERPWDSLEFERLLTERTVICHAAARRGLVIGFSMARVAADEAEILSIAVDPRQRRAGIGRLLLARQIDDVAYAGARALFLEVDAGNLAAIALYRRLQFSEVGRRNAYYRKADGNAATALIMRRAVG
jgi:[ribosomal protein S18]-alanine N-acetyltransferase